MTLLSSQFGQDGVAAQRISMIFGQNDQNSALQRDGDTAKLLNLPVDSKMR